MSHQHFHPIKGPDGDADGGTTTTSSSSAVTPRRLELILNHEDGSLQTAPLLTVIMATTDCLYSDLYKMAHGEVDVMSAQPAPGMEDDDDDQPTMTGAAAATTQQTAAGGITGAVVSRSRERLSNLSFAQRRHELAWRLASHGKAVTHVAALAASAATTEFANATAISTKALQHARTAWVQADEAQDALYFFHAQLFPARQAPHDVYGALDTILLKQWFDLPSDLRLLVDRYDRSSEKMWQAREVADRWQMAVRRKLLLGEVGWMRGLQQQQQHYQRQQQLQQQQSQPHNGPVQESQHQSHQQLLRRQHHHHHHHVPDETTSLSVPWKISVRGGIVRLTHGRPKTTIDAATGTTKTLYPLEAILTVLTTTTTTNTTTTTTTTSGTTPTGNVSGSNDISSSPSIVVDDSPTSALNSPEWTLVSVEVHAQAKTGQSNHQLDTTNKQRFNMHRLCALAMSREEARVRTMELQQRQQQQQQQRQQQTSGLVLNNNTTMNKNNNNNNTNPAHGRSSRGGPGTAACSSNLPAPARPLHALFQVAHSFALSWHLEILSAQALALRKGLWGDGGGGGTGGTGGNSSKVGGSPGGGSSIVVTPVQFFENRSILGIVSISFWSVDDRYGPPCMGDLTCIEEDDDDDDDDDDDNDKDSIHNNNDDGDAHGETTSKSTHKSSSDSVSTVSRSINNPSVTNQLTLSVRAELSSGIRVSLSGAESIMDFATDQPHVRSTIRQLVEATSNPFGLSASEALLAATRLCAERKCYAMVAVLPQVLPDWITLHVEKGSIAVAAKIRYHADGGNTNGASTTQPSNPVVLFRLTCDARTGSFVSTFSRSTPLLQYMACNDLRAASDTTLLRIANFTRLRRTATTSRGAGTTFESGRAVRDAFESLNRSMNVLGQRTGVGGAWKDHDDMSLSLRQRAIQLACQDVKVSIMTCCGMSALYGLAAVAIGVATGVQATPDMGGGKLEPPFNIEPDSGLAFLPTPPISLLLDQKLIEHSSTTGDGDRIKATFTEQELFGICCTVNDVKGLTLYGSEIKVKLDSPISIPTRTDFSVTSFVDDTTAPTHVSSTIETSNVMNGNHETVEAPAAKRPKIDTSSGVCVNGPKEIMVEVARLASILSQTLDL